jgi:hypothetical protein
MVVMLGGPEGRVEAADEEAGAEKEVAGRQNTGG